MIRESELGVTACEYEQEIVSSEHVSDQLIERKNGNVKGGVWINYHCRRPQPLPAPRIT